ncbi:MAG: alpha/beta fold hydrolase [Patescibacteria group bacterium]|nr:alpha/beta hydrolase [Patescibacteria group bacterium]
MKNALILHGTGNNSKGNWFPWLKQELKGCGWKVWVPDLPQSDKPNTKRYNQHILANREWEFNKDSVLIGHSSGAVAILGLLSHLPANVVVDTCILVGSFKDNLGCKDFSGLFQEPFDFKKIKKHAKRFVFIHSDNDPHCPLEHAKYLREQLDGELIIKKGQGHFNLEKGKEYRQFPFLLNVLEWKKNNWLCS